MTNQHQEVDDFDYGQTGSREGGGAPFISVEKKTGMFYIGRKDDGKALPHKGFAGKIVSFDIIPDEGNKDKKIRPHWKIILGIRSKDVFGGEEKVDYRFTIPSLWHYECFSFLNKACALKAWNGYFSISAQVKRDAGGKDSARYFLNFNPNREKDLEVYPWIDETQKFGPAAPQADIVGQDEDGNNILNWVKYENFCLEMAKAFYEQFWKKPYTGEVKQKTNVTPPPPQPTPPPPLPTSPAASAPEQPAGDYKRLVEMVTTKLLSKKEKTSETAEGLLSAINATTLKKYNIDASNASLFEALLSKAIQDFLGSEDFSVLVNLADGKVSLSDLPF